MLAALLFLAAEFETGKIIDAVPVSGAPQLSYALYLPSGYTPQRSWPVLYCLDPGARGRVPVERFAKAAEAEGFIVAGSNNSRNGPMEPVREAIDGMLKDTSARFSLDPKRLYAAGFSGGSRVALSWARGGQLAGVVACGAGFGQAELPKRLGFALFAAAGVDDFNYDELYDLSVALSKHDTRQRFATFPAGHEWLPPSLALAALEFFNGKLPPEPAAASSGQRKQAAQLRDTLERLETATGKSKTALIEQLRTRSADAGDTPERRLARRALGGTFIGCMERARAAMDRKDTQTAVRLLETALAIRPEAENVRAMLERAKSR